MKDMTIINIKIKTKKSNNYIIELSNGKSLEIPIDIILKYNLEKHMLITEDICNKLNQEINLIKCKEIAYKFATYKPRSIKQIRDKLIENNFKENEILLTFEFLKKYNLIDDFDYSRKFILNYILTKRVGQRKIEYELLLKGISKEIVNKAINKFYPNNKVKEFIILEIKKKKNQILRKEKEKQYIYIYNYLSNKGFYIDSNLKEFIKFQIKNL